MSQTQLTNHSVAQTSHSVSSDWAQFSKRGTRIYARAKINRTREKWGAKIAQQTDWSTGWRDVDFHRFTGAVYSSLSIKAAAPRNYPIDFETKPATRRRFFRRVGRIVSIALSSRYL